MNTIKVSWEIDEDDSDDENDDLEREATFPARKVVCDDCQGEGYVLNPSMRDHAYSSEDFDHEFDEEMQEQYFKRGGIYDVICPTCRGANVVSVIDEDRLTPAQKKDFDSYNEAQRRKAKFAREFEAEYRMERMMGA